MGINSASPGSRGLGQHAAVRLPSIGHTNGMSIPHLAPLAQRKCSAAFREIRLPQGAEKR